MGKIILGIFIGVGLLLCLVIVAGRRPNDSANEQSSYSVAETPAVSVSAAKLWSDYQANEVAADNAYKGRRLLVQGQVSSINKDFLDKTYLTFATFNEFMPVHANLNPEYVPAAAQLLRGQIISVECDGGGMVVGSPVLNNCSIRQDQPRISSEESALKGSQLVEAGSDTDRNDSKFGTPPEDVAQLMAQEEELNNKCRDGSGDGDATQKACTARDALFMTINSKDWCWGHDGQVEADKKWERCPRK